MLWIAALTLIACGGGGDACEPLHLETSPISRVPTSLSLQAGHYTHGVYPGGFDGWESDITEEHVDSYVSVVGREVAWVYFSNNWFEGRAFPADTVAWIDASGRTPWIRLMLRSDVDEVSGPDPVFSLARINAGDFDADLRQWGVDAASAGVPLIVEWGTEMNGEWFHWNATHNGGGDEGVRQFVDAYRRIVALISEGGADIAWVFHADVNDDPDACWNHLERYYPGDDVVDWVALSAYGQLVPGEAWEPFPDMLDRGVPRLEVLAPGVPIVVAEFGMNQTGNPQEAADFASEAVHAITSGRWPAVRGLSWWNETWENDDDPSHDTDMRVESGPVGAALREALDDPLVVSALIKE